MTLNNILYYYCWAFKSNVDDVVLAVVVRSVVGWVVTMMVGVVLVLSLFTS